MVGIEDLAVILRHNASTYALPVLNCYSTAKYFLLHLKGCYSAKTTQQTLKQLYKTKTNYKQLYKTVQTLFFTNLKTPPNPYTTLQTLTQLLQHFTHKS